MPVKGCPRSNPGILKIFCRLVFAANELLFIIETTSSVRQTPSATKAKGRMLTWHGALEREAVRLVRGHFALQAAGQHVQRVRQRVRQAVEGLHGREVSAHGCVQTRRAAEA